MKSIILFITMMILNCLPRQIRWENAKYWKLYKMPSYIGLRISIDSLAVYKNISLDSDRMRTFLKSLQEVKNINPIWTGLYAASYELNNKRRKVLISRYGGFFFDESSRSYYQLAEDLRLEWMDFLNESSKAIDQN